MIAYTYIEKGKFALVIRLIEAGKIDTTPLITHRFEKRRIAKVAGCGLRIFLRDHIALIDNVVMCIIENKTLRNLII